MSGALGKTWLANVLRTQLEAVLENFREKRFNGFDAKKGSRLQLLKFFSKRNEDNEFTCEVSDGVYYMNGIIMPEALAQEGFRGLVMRVRKFKIWGADACGVVGSPARLSDDTEGYELVAEESFIPPEQCLVKALELEDNERVEGEEPMNDGHDNVYRHPLNDDDDDDGILVTDDKDSESQNFLNQESQLGFFTQAPEIHDMVVVASTKAPSDLLSAAFQKLETSSQISFGSSNPDLRNLYIEEPPSTAPVPRPEPLYRDDFTSTCGFSGSQGFGWASSQEGTAANIAEPKPGVGYEFSPMPLEVDSSADVAAEVITAPCNDKNAEEATATAPPVAALVDKVVAVEVARMSATNSSLLHVPTSLVGFSFNKRTRSELVDVDCAGASSIAVESATSVEVEVADVKASIDGAASIPPVDTATPVANAANTNSSRLLVPATGFSFFKRTRSEFDKLHIDDDDIGTETGEVADGKASFVTASDSLHLPDPPTAETPELKKKRPARVLGILREISNDGDSWGSREKGDPKDSYDEIVPPTGQVPRSSERSFRYDSATGENSQSPRILAAETQRVAYSTPRGTGLVEAHADPTPPRRSAFAPFESVDVLLGVGGDLATSTMSDPVELTITDVGWSTENNVTQHSMLQKSTSAEVALFLALSQESDHVEEAGTEQSVTIEMDVDERGKRPEHTGVERGHETVVGAGGFDDDIFGDEVLPLEYARQPLELPATKTAETSQRDGTQAPRELEKEINFVKRPDGGETLACKARRAPRRANELHHFVEESTAGKLPEMTTRNAAGGNQSPKPVVCAQELNALGGEVIEARDAAVAAAGASGQTSKPDVRIVPTSPAKAIDNTSAAESQAAEASPTGIESPETNNCPREPIVLLGKSVADPRDTVRITPGPTTPKSSNCPQQAFEIADASIGESRGAGMSPAGGKTTSRSSETYELAFKSIAEVRSGGVSPAKARTSKTVRETREVAAKVATNSRGAAVSPAFVRPRHYPQGIIDKTATSGDERESSPAGIRVLKAWTGTGSPLAARRSQNKSPVELRGSQASPAKSLVGETPKVVTRSHRVNATELHSDRGASVVAPKGGGPSRLREPFEDVRCEGRRDTLESVPAMAPVTIMEAERRSAGGREVLDIVEVASMEEKPEGSVKVKEKAALDEGVILRPKSAIGGRVEAADSERKRSASSRNGSDDTLEDYSQRPRKRHATVVDREMLNAAPLPAVAKKITPLPSKLKPPRSLPKAWGGSVLGSSGRPKAPAYKGGIPLAKAQGTPQDVAVLDDRNFESRRLKTGSLTAGCVRTVAGDIPLPIKPHAEARKVPASIDGSVRSEKGRSGRDDILPPGALPWHDKSADGILKKKNLAADESRRPRKQQVTQPETSRKEFVEPKGPPLKALTRKAVTDDNPRPIKKKMLLEDARSALKADGKWPPSILGGGEPTGGATVALEQTSKLRENKKPGDGKPSLGMLDSYQGRKVVNAGGPLPPLPTSIDDKVLLEILQQFRPNTK
ncbi:hypothetical protein HK101_010389 [Irineochytrium annulatum]|nr:hypothetical protein HK101_010389 [Irineochytrium annulatum]